MRGTLATPQDLNTSSTYMNSLIPAQYLTHSLYKAPSRSSQRSRPVFPHLSQDVIDASFSFDSIVPESGEDLWNKIVKLRPELSEATRLCEIYLEHAPYLSVIGIALFIFAFLIPSAQMEWNSSRGAFQRSACASIYLTVSPGPLIFTAYLMYVKARVRPSNLFSWALTVFHRTCARYFV